MQSEKIGELAKALAKAQSEIKPAIKDAENPFFKSTYADLSACLEATLPVLNKHGIALTQVTEFQDGQFLLVTKLLHESGEWISGEYPIIGKDNSPQAMGSAITYAKRYALCAITGLQTHEDDDGEKAMGRHGSPLVKGHDAPETGLKTNKTADIKPGPGISEKQLKRLYAIAKETGWDAGKAKKWIADLGLEKAEQLNFIQYDKLVQSMQAYPEPGSKVLGN